MLIVPKNLFSVAVILICAIVLSGCGGGGTSTSSSDTIMTPPTMPEPMRQQVLKKIHEIQETERANNSDDDVVVEILGLAGLRPSGIHSPPRGIAGVGQYSLGTDDGRSDTGAYIQAEYDADGRLQFTAELHSVTSSRFRLVTTADPEASSEPLTDIPAAGWKGVELRADTPTWHNYVDLFSDIENAADDDYLAMGYWLRARKERSSTNANYRLAIGAGGNDPFQGDNIVGLTGTATYEGPATGLHMRKETVTAAPVFDHFNAQARLTADFGDASAVGTVSGAITDGMTIGGESLPELTLESANFNNNRRSFYGDTSGNGLSGKWGGKFYSNGTGPTDHPGSAAGTFGAKTADNLQSFVGAFAAYKN